ncbi:unnamed protein product [Acanthoscelides obtectus]|uniref:Uncharacterized protein n=1 Tax=Acanthoscelides obtectus TaxID=200917 RepID=A0A9P0P9T3_ACAOB|nr:unnamed protein product [Acanthoscelides obtectus]CAK1641743.1 hypothetical protein AOBTE_LOCUS12603 [Acanthoscelides obtectus]
MYGCTLTLPSARRHNHPARGVLHLLCCGMRQSGAPSTHSFISLGIKIDQAVAVDAGIRIVPKSEDDYRKIIRLFKEENVPHHTFPLPSERNIHAVIRGILASTAEQEITEELEQKGYTPLHVIRLKRNDGVSMPLVVVILPKTEKSQ